MSLSTLKHEFKTNMNTRGSFGIIVNHKKKFVCGSETRGVHGISPQEEIILDDDGNEKMYFKNLAVYDRVIIHTGNKRFNDKVIAEVKTELREHKKNNLKSMTSDEAAEAFRAASKKELNAIKEEEIRKNISSRFTIASYEGRVPKLVQVDIGAGTAVIVPVTVKWAMSGFIKRHTYDKISKFLEKELNDELSVEEVARLVNACVRMAASYAEIEKELDEENCVGGIVIVGVVHTAEKNGKEKWIQEIEHLRITAEKLEGKMDMKLVYYFFGEIIESRSMN